MFTLQNLIQAIEKARYVMFNVDTGSDEAFIDADKLLAELRGMDKE